jgi:pimeloyl-ACP methyl ester carboxylesterase
LQLNISICGQGPPLLLLNGLGGLIRTFDPLRDELADYTTITLDVPCVDFICLELPEDAQLHVML